MTKNIGDMTNDELKDFIIELQEENSRCKRKIEKAINKIEEFNKKEKLSMYVDTWQHLLPILKILKGDKE